MTAFSFFLFLSITALSTTWTDILDANLQWRKRVLDQIPLPSTSLKWAEAENSAQRLYFQKLCPLYRFIKVEAQNSDAK